MIQHRDMHLSKDAYPAGPSDWNVSCDHNGYAFSCFYTRKCCGRMCIDRDAVCCENTVGVNFPCDQYSSCCGNACAGLNSKCCLNVHDYQYPVPRGIPCETDLSIRCENRFGETFPCFQSSSCCQDICVGAGGKCCFNKHGSAYACGEGSDCCGDVCVGPGGVCCDVNGHPTPLSQDVYCEKLFHGGHHRASSKNNTFPALPVQEAAAPASEKPHYSVGEEGNWTHEPAKQASSLAALSASVSDTMGDVQCAAGSTLCGNVCMPEGSICCTSEHGYRFQCGQGSSCCGNACAAPESTCCNALSATRYKFPVAPGSPCPLLCRHGNSSILCGTESTCCGPLCVGYRGSCCQNDQGNYFACGEGSKCCGNVCSAVGIECLAPMGRGEEP